MWGVQEKVYASGTITIDVTKLATGDEISHDCNKYLVTKYDNTYHWKECSICGKIYENKEKHNMIDNGWTYGDAKNCAPANVHRFSCSCGYSYTNTIGKAAHQFPDEFNCTCWFQHLHKHCKVCASGATVYKNNVSGRCYPASGKRDCTTPFICAECGAYNGGSTGDSKNHNGYVETDADNVVCKDCGKLLMKSQHSNYYINSKGQGVFTTVFELPEGSTILSSSPVTEVYGSSAPFFRCDSQTMSISGNKVTVVSYLTNIAHTENVGYVYHYFQYKYQNETLRALSYCSYDNGDGTGWRHRVSADMTAPSINNPTQKDLSSSNGWATQKQLTFTGTENYCKTVTLTLKDNTGKVVNSGIASVNNGKWTWNIIPDIEADENGTIYTITATDTLLNKSSKVFKVYKTDKKAPTIISGDATSTEWSKSKDYEAKATDKGVGNVSIAFNKVSNYVEANKSGTTYSQNYHLVGDVYGNIQASILFKDALGNETSKIITISNIDNTAPTITKTDISSTAGTSYITVTANDKKDFGGSIGIKEGSGVSSYAISSSNTVPSDDSFQTSNVLSVDKSGTYYIFVKDKVGNVSSKSLGTINVLRTVNFNYNKPNTASVLTGNNVSSKNVTYGNDYGALPSPNLNGYNFLGWYTSATGGNQIVSTTKYLSDNNTTLYAHWSINTYSITYNLNGGNLSNPRTTYTVNDSFSLGIPFKNGYTFKGWTGSNGSTAQTNVTINKGSTGNKSYTANWNTNTYLITYNLNGGTISNQPTSYNIETPTFTIPQPTRNGYIFEGWSGTGLSSNTKSVTINKGSTGNRTYTAHWKPVTYSITYNLNGGSISNQPTSYTIDSNTFSIPHPIKNGYTFKGWTGSNGSTPQIDVSISKGSTGNKTFIANWSANNYNVYFDYNKPSNASNPITNNSVTSKNVTFNTAYGTLPNPSLDGWIFEGWFTQVNGGTLITSTSIYNIVGSQTLYAHWTPIKYTIKYDSNGGKGTMADTIVTFDGMTKLRKNTFTKDGYKFQYWYISRVNNGKTEWYYGKSDGNWLSNKSWYELGKNPSGTTLYKVTDEHTFHRSNCINNAVLTAHAEWKANNYVVSFNYNKPNNATNNIDGNSITSKNVTFDSAYGTLPNPTLKGWTFVGWYTSASGGSKITASSIYRVVGNQTLYAYWVSNSYTISFNYNKPANSTSIMSGNTIATKQVNYDSPYGTLPTPSMKGWTFNGWYTSPTGGTRILSTTIFNMTASNQTLYAHWSANIYSITLDSNLGGAKGTTGTTIIYEKFDNGYYSDKGCTNKITSITIPKKIGSIFEGYYDGKVIIANNGNIAVNTNYFVNNVILKATWKSNTYTIVFDGNRNSGGSTTSMSYTWSSADTPLTINNFNRIGWKYNNWNTKVDSKGRTYNNGQLINNQFFIDNLGEDTLLDGKPHTVTLYAIWSDIITPTISEVKIQQETLVSQVNSGKIILTENQAFTGDLYTNINIKVNENNINNDASGIKEVKVYVYDKNDLNSNKTYDITNNKSNIVNTKYDYYYNNVKYPYSATYTFKENLYTAFPNASRLGIYVYVTDYQGNTTKTAARWNKVLTDKADTKDIPQDSFITVKDDIEDIVFNETNASIYSSYINSDNTNDFIEGESGYVHTWTYGYVEKYSLDYGSINAEMEREIKDMLLSEENRMNRTVNIDMVNGTYPLSAYSLQSVRIPPYVLKTLSRVSENKTHTDGTNAYEDMLGVKYNAIGYKKSDKTSIYNVYNILDNDYQNVHYRTGV